MVNSISYLRGESEESRNLRYSRGPSYFGVQLKGIGIQLPSSGAPVYLELNTSDKKQAHNAADQVAKGIYEILKNYKNDELAEQVIFFVNSQGGAVAMDILIRYPFLAKYLISKCTGFYSDFCDLTEEEPLDKTKHGYKHIKYIGGWDGDLDIIFPPSIHLGEKNNFFKDLLRNHENTTSVVRFEKIKGMKHSLNGGNDFQILRRVLNGDFSSSQPE